MALLSLISFVIRKLANLVLSFLYIAYVEN